MNRSISAKNTVGLIGGQDVDDGIEVLTALAEFLWSEPPSRTIWMTKAVSLGFIVLDSSECQAGSSNVAFSTFHPRFFVGCSELFSSRSLWHRRLFALAV